MRVADRGAARVEEAGVEPELITSCSGGTIWGSMWAAGMSAQEMADFSLAWRLEGLSGHAVGEAAALRARSVARLHRPPVRGRRHHRPAADAADLDDGGFDRVFAANFMLPPQLEPEDITGWQTHQMGVLRASRQAEQGFHLEFALRSRQALGDALTVIDAADHRLLRGPAFYELFIDRSRWPELIREGYERANHALEPFRGRRRST